MEAYTPISKYVSWLHHNFVYFSAHMLSCPAAVWDWSVVVVRLNVVVLLIYIFLQMLGGAHLWKHTHPFLSMSHGFTTILFISLHTCCPWELGCDGELCSEGRSALSVVNNHLLLILLAGSAMERWYVKCVACEQQLLFLQVEELRNKLNLCLQCFCGCS